VHPRSKLHEEKFTPHASQILGLANGRMTQNRKQVLPTTTCSVIGRQWQVGAAI